MISARKMAAAVASLAVLATTSVSSFAAATVGEDIRDIRAPLPMGAWQRWGLTIAGATIAALAVIVVLRWWKMRRARARSPLEQARRALRVAEDHAREGRYRAWADLITETLRGALAARFGVGILPQTTAELASEAWARWSYEGPVGARHEAPDARLPEAPSVVLLLEACDLARFARATLTADALHENTEIARDLVERLFAARSRAPERAQSTQSPGEVVTP